MQVNHTQLKSLISKSLEMDKPLMILSQFGLGKSMIVQEAALDYASKLEKRFIDWNRLSDEDKHRAVEAKELNNSMFFIDIRLSQKDPSDLTGIPFVSGNHMKWFPPTVIKLLSNPTCKAVVFFDELSDASVPVMKSAYQLVLDRCCGEVSFSKGVRILAAGNRTIDRCGVNDTPKALDNRFMNVELKPPSANDWTKWAMEKDIDSRLISFIMFQPDLLCQDVKTIQTKSFPTPRSVAMLGDMIKSESDTEVIGMLAGACCGDGFAASFVSYLDNAKDVDPERILGKPSLFDELKLGAKWFSISALAQHYKKHGNKVVPQMIEVMKVMDPDMAFVQFYMNKEANKLFPSQMAKIPEGEQLYTEFSKYIL